jgi:hypothetical protein
LCSIRVLAAPLPGLINSINIRDVNSRATEDGAVLVSGDVAPAEEQPGDTAGVRREGIVGVVGEDVAKAEGDIGQLAGFIDVEATNIICKNDRDW